MTTLHCFSDVTQTIFMKSLLFSKYVG